MTTDLVPTLDAMDPERQRVVLVDIAAHLAEAGQLGRLHRLLLDGPRWMEVKFQRLGGDHWYLNDLRLAIAKQDVLCTAESLLTLLQLHIARTVVRTRVSRLAGVDLATLVWLGRGDEAAANARLRDDVDQRCSALLAICKAWAEQRQLHSLLRCLPEVRQAIDAVQDEFRRVTWLLRQAAVLVDAGAVRDASTTLTEARDVLCGVPDPQVETSMVDIGISIVPWDGGPEPPELPEVAHVEAVGNYNRRLELFRDLARLQAAAGLFDASADTLASIVKPDLRVEVNCVVAQERARQQQWGVQGERAVEQALSDTRRVADIQVRAYLLALIAHALDAINDGHRAARICGEIHALVAEIETFGLETVAKDQWSALPGYSRDGANLALIETVYNLGKIAAPLEQARRPRDADAVLCVADRLASALPTAASDDVGELLGDQPARYTIQRLDDRIVAIESQYARPVDARRALAESYARCGRFRAAKRVATAIDHQTAGPAACYAVARAMVSCGQVDDALALLERIGALVLFDGDEGPQRIEVTNYMQSVTPYAVSRFTGRSHIAFLAVETLARRGELEAAQVVREGSDDDYARLEMLRILAHVAARNADPRAPAWLDESRSAAADLADSFDRDYAIHGIARALVQCGNTAAATRVVPEVRHLHLRADAYRVAAEIAAGDEGDPDNREAAATFWDAARQTIAADPEHDTRAAGFALLARAQARLPPLDGEAITSDMQAAIAEMDNIDPPPLRVPVLIALAETAELLGGDETAPPQARQSIQQLAMALYSDGIKAACETFPRFASIPLHRDLAESMLQHGHPDLAGEALNEILYLLGGRYPFAHGNDAAGVAEALARTGEFDLAVSLAAAARDDTRFREPHLRAIHGIVVALCVADRVTDAAQLMLAIVDRYTVARTLSEVAVTLHRRGDGELGRTAIELAQSAASRIADGPGRARAGAAVAISLSDLGRFADAYQRAGEIDDVGIRTTVANSIAARQAQSGDFVSGLEHFNPPELDVFILELAHCSESLERVQVGLAPVALGELARIACWTRTDWQPLHRTLVEAAP